MDPLAALKAHHAASLGPVNHSEIAGLITVFEQILRSLGWVPDAPPAAGIDGGEDGPHEPTEDPEAKKLFA